MVVAINHSICADATAQTFFDDNLVQAALQAIQKSRLIVFRVGFTSFVTVFGNATDYPA